MITGITLVGSDYYEIELGEFQEQMHPDLPPTTIRGYRQVNMGGTPFHYLGPTIVAQRDVPVRIKFINSLPTEAGGDLFIPVDTTVMGAGHGDLGGSEPLLAEPRDPPPPRRGDPVDQRRHALPVVDARRARRPATPRA